MIDTNVHLGHWPFRHHGYEATSALIARLRKAGITEAWAASFEGIFHEDLASANARHVEECQKQGQGMLVPVATVNPKLPAWEDDLRRCLEVHPVRIVRLYPGYHGYTLADSLTESLLARCASSKLLVQIVLKMEDDRTQHPLMPIPAVDPAPLSRLLPKLPGLKIQLLNSQGDPRTEVLVPIVRAGEVYVDTAMFEAVGVVRRLIDRVGVDRVLLGSHFPLFYPESAILKLREADLDVETIRKLETANARSLLPKQ